MTMRAGRHCGRPKGHTGTHRSVAALDKKDAWQAGNPENIRRAGKKSAAKREASRKQHDYHVLTYYGITGEQYWNLYEAQGGRCYICQKSTGRTKRLAVDHNHSCRQGHAPNRGCPECVRGLLCSPCNIFLGRMGDNPDAFIRAALYLQAPPFQLMRKATRNVQAA